MLCSRSYIAGAQRRGSGSSRSMLKRAALLLLLLPVLHGCSAGDDADLESRSLATIDAALDAPDLTAELLAQQHRLFEVLAENRTDELSQYLDLSFRFTDMHEPSTRQETATVGEGYVPPWREPDGLNYYQFMAAGIPAHEWSGRTLEIVWSTASVALTVAHHEERDPVFTQWARREDGWTVMRLTINSSDESLQAARESRRMNR